MHHISAAAIIAAANSTAPPPIPPPPPPHTAAPLFYPLPLLPVLAAVCHACGQDVDGVPDGVRVAVSGVLGELGKEEGLVDCVGEALELMEPAANGLQ